MEYKRLLTFSTFLKPRLCSFMSHLKTPWLVGIPQDSDWAKRWTSKKSSFGFRRGAGIFSVLQCIQTGCHFYTDACSLCDVSAFPQIQRSWDAGSLTTRLHPAIRLRTHGAVTSILSTPQFVYLLISTKTILRTFTFKNAHYLSLFSVE